LFSLEERNLIFKLAIVARVIARVNIVLFKITLRQCLSPLKDRTKFTIKTVTLCP